MVKAFLLEQSLESNGFLSERGVDGRQHFDFPAAGCDIGYSSGFQRECNAGHCL